MQQELGQYFAHLLAVQRNPQGEVSNGTARDFTFEFGPAFGNAKLTVQMMEALQIYVNGVAVTNLDAPFIDGNDSTTTGQVVEDGDSDSSLATAQSATGTLTFVDLDWTDSHSYSTTPPAGALGSIALLQLDDSTGDGVGHLQWTYTLNNASVGVQQLAAGQTVTEVHQVRIQDSNNAGNFVVQNVTVTITGTNDGPVAVADVAAGTENQTLTIDVLANDTDVDDGHVFTLNTASAPANKGTASVVGNQLVFNPGTDFDHLAEDATEVVTLSYEMQDEHGATSSSTVTVTITGTNDGPVAVADVAAGTENQTLTIDVLANDTDVDDGHVFTLVTASAPANKGTASVVGNQLVFNPGTDFDHLAEAPPRWSRSAYEMQDEHGATSSTTVTVTVTGTNDGPVAVADTAAGTENQTLTIDVLANDTDVDDGHVFTLVTRPVRRRTRARPAWSATSWCSTPAPTSTTWPRRQRGGHAQLRDAGRARRDLSSTVTVTVTGTNDGPVAVADTAAGDGEPDADDRRAGQRHRRR